MEQGLREVCRSVRIGKILIQRVSGVLYAFYQHVAQTCLLGRRDNTSQTLLFQSTLPSPLASFLYRKIDHRTHIAPSGYRRPLCSSPRSNAWYDPALSESQFQLRHDEQLLVDRL